MIKLFNFHCSRHGVFEAWANTGEKAPCPTCEFQCPQTPAYRGIKLNGADPGFPRAWRMWADRHERHEESGLEI